jgi:type IV secretion system protein TrbL
MSRLVGVKVMALALVVSIGESIFTSYIVSPEPTWSRELRPVGGGHRLILMLAFKIPAIAAAQITGGPAAFSAGSAASSVVGIAATVGGLALAGRLATGAGAAGSGAAAASKLPGGGSGSGAPPAPSSAGSGSGSGPSAASPASSSATSGSSPAAASRGEDASPAADEAPASERRGPRALDPAPLATGPGRGTVGAAARGPGSAFAPPPSDPKWSPDEPPTTLA